MNADSYTKEAIAKLIEEVRLGNKLALRKVYLNHREAFIGWATRKFRCREQDALDVYQEVIIAFYENVVAGKVTSLRSNLQTYLFGIGRNMILREFQRNGRFEELEVGQAEQLEGEGNYGLELNQRQVFLQQALGKLGKSCQEILQLFYYQRFASEAIMHQMGYNNTDVVKSQKARCLRSLRKLLEQHEDDLR